MSIERICRPNDELVNLARYLLEGAESEALQAICVATVTRDGAGHCEMVRLDGMPESACGTLHMQLKALELRLLQDYLISRDDESDDDATEAASEKPPTVGTVHQLKPRGPK